MKIDKSLMVAFGLMLAGLDNLLLRGPYPKGSKIYCAGQECTYLGLISFMVGIAIIGYKVYKWKKEKGTKT